MRTQCVVPHSVYQLALETGEYFSRVSRVPAEALTADFLDLTKARCRAQILMRYAKLEGRRLLEIGSGFGANIAVWTMEYGVDAGVEPSGASFGRSFDGSRLLFRENGLNPDRIVATAGEALPFDDDTFDIVYSANVLEHTQDPLQVLFEAARVVQPGGVCHMEIPNFPSYFEGHYMVLSFRRGQIERFRSGFEC